MYHRHFIEYAWQWLGRGVPAWHSYEIEVPLHTFLGVSKTTYRRIKLGFRQGGLKRSMPAYEHASELSRSLRQAGALVMVCTTRPYLHLSNIEPDTREWLRRNRVQYDAIFYGEHKYRNLAREFGRDRVVAILDDLPEMWEQARKCGIDVLARSNPHNAHYLDNHPEWFEATNLFQAEEALLAKVDAWFKEKDYG
jgi:hypothetical protein